MKAMQANWIHVFLSIPSLFTYKTKQAVPYIRHLFITFLRARFIRKVHRMMYIRLSSPSALLVCLLCTHNWCCIAYNS